jgi:hypothetical protein
MINNTLRRGGYVITRPTQIERTFSRNPWGTLFGTNPALFAEVYSQNRTTLQQIPQWASQGILDNSLWRYGIPVEWAISQRGVPDRTGLDDVEPNITTADVLAFLARQTGSLSYLEIGVSVGKTLLQIERQTKNAHIVGLDIEEINPVLRDHFDSCELKWSGHATYKVDAINGRKVSKLPKLLSLRDEKRNVSFDYLSADQFRDDTWQHLSGRKFNLIYSDGVHSGTALHSEFSFLRKYDLIDTSHPFAMVWDDMWNMEMQSAFFAIAKELCAIFKADDDSISLYTLHGSYGLQHPVALFRWCVR